MSGRSRHGLIGRGIAIFASVFTALGAVLGGHHNSPKAVESKPPLELKLQGQVSNLQHWEQIYLAGDELYRSGKYDEAYKRWAECLVVAETEDAASAYEGARQIDVLQKLAVVYKTQQKPVEAAHCYEKAVSLTSSLYGKDDGRLAPLLMDLGRIYEFYEPTKNLSKADEVFSEAFRINEKLYGRYTIATGDVAIAMGMLRQSQLRFAEAVEFFSLAVEIGNRLEPNVISCCRIGPRQGLAESYEKLGRFDEALKVHQELIAMAKAGAPGMLSTVVSSCASCLQKMGRAEEARALSATAK
jgi:tetratricopeptide (TPR) repeat protein